MPALPRLDETDYTNALASALDTYAKEQGAARLGATTTPHTAHQSPRRLDSSRPFDLMKRLTESAIIVLEVKVSDDGDRLRSFDSRQRVIDAALRDAKIPLDYCYNLVEDYTERDDPTYTLDESITAPPDDICDDSGRLTKGGKHRPLRKLVDELLADGQNGTALGALFAKGVLTRLRQVNAKVLFFARHLEDQQLEVLDLEQLLTLYHAYEASVKLEGIDLDGATRDELREHFRTAAASFAATLQNFLLRAPRVRAAPAAPSPAPPRPQPKPERKPRGIGG